MCTISIVPDGAGFRVMSNRDERRDRAVALQPRFETLESRTAIMPIDPAGGGSWIGVNDRGLVAAILNRHAVRPVPSGSFTSRGAIVRQALACDSAEAAVEAVRTLDATRFQPFRLVLVQKSQMALVVSNGHELAHAESTLEQPCMFTASSLGDIFVDSPRRRLFECLMEHVGDRLDGQRLFHRHQWADKREVSVLMDREDATTVSRTIVDVGAAGIALEYESLVPFGPAHRLELPPC
jgi:uncharacterized protein with NRDE domain